MAGPVMDLPLGGRRSVLAKSKSCGVGDVLRPAAEGRRLCTGAVLVNEVP